MSTWIRFKALQRPVDTPQGVVPSGETGSLPVAAALVHLDKGHIRVLEYFDPLVPKSQRETRSVGREDAYVTKDVPRQAIENKRRSTRKRATKKKG